MDTEVLIAGAGPTGLTLAIELARRGIDVRIVDRAGQFSAGSRADGLQPRTLEVFEDLGVLEQLFADGIGAPLMRIYHGESVVWESRMADPVPPRPDMPYPNVWFVPQWRTEEILRTRLRGYGINVELSAEVVAIKQGPEADGVRVRMRTGETLRAAYLVGADGGGSTVRRELGIPFLGATDEQVRMLLADVRVDGLDHDYGHGWMLDDNCFFGFTPLAGDGDSFVLSTMAPDVEPTPAVLQAKLDAVSGRTDIRLREVTWATVWRSNVRLAQQFRSDRVFLAGDAAHVHPPTGGQGLNTGVQDAYNLGWKLATAITTGPGDAEALLDSYQHERLPIASRVLGVSTELLDKSLRGNDDALHRGEETRQLDLSYRGGPLSLDDAGSAVLAAGDRAPDAPCLRASGERVRLFTLFGGPHWTLLRFGPDSPRLEHDWVRSYRIGIDLLDVDRHIQRGYGVSEDAAVLIRPDGYLGAITARPAALEAYGKWLLPGDRSCCATGPAPAISWWQESE